jgi:hypothetical protein
MNENIKTLIVAAIGVGLAGLGYATLPAPSTNVLPDRVGKALFSQFDDSAKAASLKIVRFDADKNKVESLQVAKKGELWTLPSHGDYPADAKESLKDAAASLLGVKGLGKATEFSEEHHLFGVLDPTQKIDDAHKKDVGMMVVIADAKGDDLVRMIIGKPVKDQQGQRFVRVAEGQTFTDDVYVAKVDVDKLPTDFNKWIEQDLLQLSPLDVQKLTLMDYSVLKEDEGYLAQKRMEAGISWDTIQALWNLDKFQVYTQGRPHDAALGEGEELNKQKLDEMKSALDELKIENVARKPAEKPEDKGKLNEKQLQAHVRMGFIPAKDGTLYSTNGEVIVDLKDGVRYVLRFGDIAGVQAGSDGQKLNRYLMVNAEVSEDLLKPPVLEAEPAGPAAKPPTTPPAEEKPAEKETPKPNGGACQEEEKKEEPKAAPAKTKAKDDGKGAKAKTEPGKTEGRNLIGPDPPMPSVKPVKPNTAQLEIDRIRKANQRKMDDYNLKKKKAEAKVAELNARFKDWYYVISEDTYKKIHLGRTDIIREGATAKETGFGIDAFRLLEQQGIKPPPPPAAEPPPGRGPGGRGGFPGGFPGLPPM